PGIAPGTSPGSRGDSSRITLIYIYECRRQCNMDAPLKPQHATLVGVEQTAESLLDSAATQQVLETTSTPLARSKLAHIFLLLPPLQATHPDWYPIVGCVLSWQLRWLRAHAAS